MTRVSPRAIGWLVLLGLVLGTAALLVRAAWTDSVTNDETIYIHSGACAFNARLIDLEPTNPAGFKLMAGFGAVLSGVPTDKDCTTTSYRTLMPGGLRQHDLRRLVLFSRLPAIAATLALVVVSALWAAQLGGILAAVAAAAFVGFDPTVIAHGHLATGDIPLTLGVVGCLASTWNWRRDGRRRWLVLAGLALGFACLNKASAVLLLPVLIVVLVLIDSGPPIARLRRVIRPSLMVGAVAYLTLIVAYAPFRHNEPKHSLPDAIGWLIPQSWLWGANWQRHHVAGSGGFVTYLNGSRHLGGRLIYLPEALILKMTIAALLALAIGTVTLAVRRRSGPLIWCGLPAVLYMAAAIESGINIGIRYIAPAIALLLILASVGLAGLPRRLVPLAALLAAGGIAATALGPAGSIGYFNALASRRHSYYLADSNIDFGQDGWRLRDWWRRHGNPPIQVDMFGGLPARFFVPSARDVGVHGERLDNRFVPDAPGRILIVSVNTGTIETRRSRAISTARCYIGTSLVVVGGRCESE